MSRLDAIRVTLRQAQATDDHYEGEDSWLSAYRRDVGDLLAVVDAAERGAESISDCFSRFATGDLEGDEFLNAVRASGVRLTAAVARLSEERT